MRSYIGLIFFGLLLCCTPATAEWIDNGDGTVTDTELGLMWQQDQSDPLDWYTALDYCENLELADYDDWRMPNVKELQTIIDYEVLGPAIDISIFPDTQGDYHWSSTTYFLEAGLAITVRFFLGGKMMMAPKNIAELPVRAVRGGQ